MLEGSRIAGPVQPFGELLFQDGDADNRPKVFAGHARDNGSDLVYMMARSYSPTLARFVSPDPIPTDNRYTYANLNPLTYIDLDGFAPFSVHSRVTREVYESKGYSHRYAYEMGRATAMIDKSLRYGPVFNWPGHFSNHKLPKLIQEARTRYAVGDIEGAKKAEQRAMHLSMDIHYHGDISPASHFFRKLFGWFQKLFTGKNTLDPDSPDSIIDGKTAAEREADGKAEMETTHDAIHGPAPPADQTGTNQSTDQSNDDRDAPAPAYTVLIYDTPAEETIHRMQDRYGEWDPKPNQRWRPPRIRSN